jgi:hypothetical protein
VCLCSSPSSSGSSRLLSPQARSQGRPDSVSDTSIIPSDKTHPCCIFERLEFHCANPCGSSLVRLPTLALLSRSRLLRLHIPLTVEGSASKVSIHFYTSRPRGGPSTSLIFRILLFGRFDGFFPLHLPFLSRYGPHSHPLSHTSSGLMQSLV